MTIKMRLSKMLFFLCFRPTIKFQDGSLVDPLFDPLPTPLLTRPLKNYFYRHFGVSEAMRIKFVKADLRGLCAMKVVELVFR